jgi:hypothetical protein
MRVWLVLGFMIGLLAGPLALAGPAHAQYNLDISLEDYLAEVGPDAKLVAAGKLVIDGKRMRCGRRPTVMNPKFDSWGGAYPGFVILNPDRIKDLATPVKLYVYAHECGHQFVGRSEEAADCFAVKRGRRYGWLDQDGMEDICTFISKLKGTRNHPPGPVRCAKMRVCYRNAVRARASQN